MLGTNLSGYSVNYIYIMHTCAIVSLPTFTKRGIHVGKGTSHIMQLHFLKTSYVSGMANSAAPRQGREIKGCDLLLVHFNLKDHSKFYLHTHLG
jgi:hypothetical protein